MSEIVSRYIKENPSYKILDKWELGESFKKYIGADLRVSEPRRLWEELKKQWNKK